MHTCMHTIYSQKILCQPIGLSKGRVAENAHMYLYRYVCVYIYTHTHACMHTYNAQPNDPLSAARVRVVGYVHICIYVCVCVCMYTYTYIHACIQKCTAEQSSVCLGVQTRVRVAGYAIYVYMYIYIHAYNRKKQPNDRLSAFEFKQGSEWRDMLYVCVCVYIYIYVYVYTYKYIHTYIYIYTYIHTKMHSPTILCQPSSSSKGQSGGTCVNVRRKRKKKWKKGTRLKQRSCLSAIKKHTKMCRYDAL